LICPGILAVVLSCANWTRTNVHLRCPPPSYTHTHTHTRTHTHAHTHTSMRASIAQHIFVPYSSFFAIFVCADKNSAYWPMSCLPLSLHADQKPSTASAFSHQTATDRFRRKPTLIIATCFALALLCEVRGTTNLFVQATSW